MLAIALLCVKFGHLALVSLKHAAATSCNTAGAVQGKQESLQLAAPDAAAVQHLLQEQLMQAAAHGDVSKVRLAICRSVAICFLAA
jgi:hypothetical protein